MTDKCWFKHMNYTPSCSECSGTDNKVWCYKTEEQVEEHLKGFSELMLIDDGTIEERVEEQFDFKNFGMGFR